MQLTRKAAPQSSVSARRNVAPRPRAVITRANAEKSAFAKFSDSIGMDTSEGYFGFTPFAETWVGRWSMMGFVSSIVVEFATGKGTLAQVGLDAPSGSLLAAMCVIFGGATVAGTALTVQQLLTRKMSRSQAERYRAFLGLTKKDDWMSDNAAKTMKGRPDFTTPGNDMAAIEATRAAGMPADRFLSVNGVEAAAQTAASEMKTSTTTAVAEPPAAPAPKREPTMQDLYGVDDATYAREVEMTNGRAAMLGFLAAILVEAGTGEGIIRQIITYLKWSGILGPMSGF
ncbi:hypothetical protein HYH02_001262 [Chlamydomonas schloesseri]|uniref:Uncharacterized protein n=1 Tax=Chlamydomonas schloesseri TaxID=2026947 RepID=A0A835WU17_9CHLO|nr:hypothetical protein HYH02_001262 [Chlamydomonas schloesseri]|eukprot:KAG2454228.1 hypothetical protein HYH02_001262 [Chlamydomonas schloesseri]